MSGLERTADDGTDGRRHVLVVSTLTEVDDALRRHLEPSDIVKLVVPAVGQGLLDWLANDERAFAVADGIADRMADDLPGDTVDSGPGEADIGLAIRDALATFPADEIVVAVPSRDEHLDASLATDASRGGATIEGVPVRVVTMGRA